MAVLRFDLFVHVLLRGFSIISSFSRKNNDQIGSNFAKAIWARAIQKVRASSSLNY